MNSAHAKEERLAAVARLCDGFGEPGTAAAKRIPRGGKPDSESPDQRAVAVVGRREATLAEIAKCLGRKDLADIAGWRSRTRFWPGIGRWWHRSATAPTTLRRHSQRPDGYSSANHIWCSFRNSSLDPSMDKLHPNKSNMLLHTRQSAIRML